MVWQLRISSNYRLRARNTSWSTLSGFSADLRQVIMLPLVLKARSDGALVAWMHKYFFARLATCGKLAMCCLHHSRGLISPSASTEGRGWGLRWSLARRMAWRTSCRFWSTPWKPVAWARRLSRYTTQRLWGMSARTLSIRCSKVAGALHSQNGITLNCHSPWPIEKAVRVGLWCLLQLPITTV